MTDLLATPETPLGYRMWRPSREQQFVFDIPEHRWQEIGLYERLMTNRMDCVAASMKPGTPVVYFVQGMRHGPLKIGTADCSRVKARLAELQTGNPDRLAVRRTIRGGRALESEIHDLLAVYRLSGEWFAPDAQVLRLIGQSPKALERSDDAYEYHVGYWHGRQAGRTRYYMAGKAAGFREAQKRTLAALGFSARGEVQLTYSQMEPAVRIVGP